VFLTRLDGRELYDHGQAHSQVAETERTEVQPIYVLGLVRIYNNTLYLSVGIALLIGYATGKQIQTSTRTNGVTAAPIASP
jgi:hypothetical protein